MQLGITPRASTIDHFHGLLIRSRLLDAEEAQVLLKRWHRERPADPEDAEHFTHWLIAQKAVTPYQILQLHRGHVDHCWVDEYKLLDRVAKGQMAGVYQAVHPLGQVVALKVLPPSRASHPNILARFRREARMALRLKHPHVVRAFYFAETAELVYLVMEYLEGETLQEVLRQRGKLPVAEGVRLIHQALLGLQHLHEKRLVHRDLKPANLMLAGRPASNHTLHAAVKILDIGLGKDFLDDVGEEAAAGVHLTSEGSLLGTPDYLAPEQARDARSVDIRADIYSLGCVLYHVLSGQTPFAPTNVFQLILRHATEEPRGLRELEPSVPKALQDAVRRMMAKDPAQRYETPAQAAEALKPFLPAHDATPAATGAVHVPAFLAWIEEKAKSKKSAGRAAKPRRSASNETATPFELSGLRPRVAVPGATPAAVVATTVVELSPEERARLAGQPVRPGEGNRSGKGRTRLFLAAGMGLGVALTLGIEALFWLAFR